MKIVYYSLTGQTERFVNKITEDAIRIDENKVYVEIGEDFLLVIPSYEPNVLPELYELLEDFLETGNNIKNCKGILAGGNRNFSKLFGVTGNLVGKKYGIDVLHYFEFSGSNEDIKKLNEYLNKK